MPIGKKVFLELLQKMLLTRKMEDRHRELLKKNAPIAFAHFGTGMEAVGIGAMSALRKDDVMIGCHRGFAEYIGKGMDPVDIWAEYLGKKKLLNGKAGIQLSDKEFNIPGMTACIGGSYALAVGIAYAIKEKKEDRVVVISYGDGGYNQSDVHPAMVIASSWKLPLIFHVANNGWAEYTPSKEFIPTKNLAVRGVAYNIPAKSVNGQRVDIVYNAAKQAIEHARSGKGPYFMEYMTYRLGPHFSGDPGEYITEKEKRDWPAKDPINIARKFMISQGIITAAEFKKIETEADNRAEETLQFALKLPDADASDLYANIFA